MTKYSFTAGMYKTTIHDKGIISYFSTDLNHTVKGIKYTIKVKKNKRFSFLSRAVYTKTLFATDELDATPEYVDDSGTKIKIVPANFKYENLPAFKFKTDAQEIMNNKIAGPGIILGSFFLTYLLGIPGALIGATSPYLLSKGINLLDDIVYADEISGAFRKKVNKSFKGKTYFLTKKQRWLLQNLSKFLEYSELSSNNLKGYINPFEEKNENYTRHQNKDSFPVQTGA